MAALDHVMRPDDEELSAAFWALELHAEHERWGNPHGPDAPSGYMYAIGCVRAARERAEGVNRAMEAASRQQAQEGTEEDSDAF